MTDPTRLVERGANDVELALLRAGVADEPSRRAIQRAAAALGLAAGIGATAPGAVAASTAGQAGLWTTLKVVGAGLLVTGGLAVGAAQLFGEGPAPQQRTLAPQAESPPRATGRQAAKPTAAQDPADMAAAPRTEVPKRIEQPAATDVKPSTRSGSAVGRNGASIAEETAMIDAARRQLGAKNPTGALRQLDAYRAKFSRGMLAQEATLLRVEALAQSGNRAAARQLARRQLERNPNSQYARRLEPFLGNEPTNPSTQHAQDP
jgi:hypothetical protein